ncbi:hypothetical protein CARUB_v10003549mg [Capsella rubella]|uniref:Uncharacterized protein n=1 Tax=Capsella rubella TaxID=81985 RepID=R0FCZ1_9BRAS|nr:hypothetical protein CARUB_v10003549mg [Capsella rubella]
MASLVFAPVLVPPRILPLPDLWPFALLPHLSNVMAPPEPPDPPDPTYGLVGLSSFSPFIMLFMFADLQSKLVLAWVVLVPLMPFDGTPFVSLRYLTVVCSAWYQSLPLASLELWFSTPRLSHSLVTLSQGFVLDEMISASFRLSLPQYEAAMSSLKLCFFLPQYEAVLFPIGFRIPLPQYEEFTILFKLMLLLPPFEDAIQKLWPRSIRVIVPLTLYVLTCDNLGSWIPDLFIESWWFLQPHTSPKLRFPSHLVGSGSWCFVAFAFVAIFQDAIYSVMDAASLDRRSPSVLFDFQSFISRFSTLSCLIVVYASIIFFHVYRLASLGAVSLAFVAFLLYLLNNFSIVGD